LGVLIVFAPLTYAACGDDAVVPDASTDATLDIAEEPIVDAAPDVDLDAPPVRAIWVASPTTLYTFDPTSIAAAKRWSTSR
jgi:hypothetical protein